MAEAGQHRDSAREIGLEGGSTARPGATTHARTATREGPGEEQGAASVAAQARAATGPCAGATRTRQSPASRAAVTSTCDEIGALTSRYTTPGVPWQAASAAIAPSATSPFILPEILRGGRASGAAGAAPP